MLVRVCVGGGGVCVGGWVGRGCVCVCACVCVCVSVSGCVFAGMTSKDVCNKISMFCCYDRGIEAIVRLNGRDN